MIIPSRISLLHPASLRRSRLHTVQTAVLPLCDVHKPGTTSNSTTKTDHEHYNVLFRASHHQRFTHNTTDMGSNSGIPVPSSRRLFALSCWSTKYRKKAITLTPISSLHLHSNLHSFASSLPLSLHHHCHIPS